MKIYSKVVLNMTTMEVVSEEAFEYKGPIALCGGGGGSQTSYPGYLTDIHRGFLNEEDYSVRDLLHDYLTAQYNPIKNYTEILDTVSARAYSGDYERQHIANALTDVKNAGTYISPHSDWDNAVYRILETLDEYNVITEDDLAVIFASVASATLGYTSNAMLQAAGTTNLAHGQTIVSNASTDALADVSTAVDSAISKANTLLTGFFTTVQSRLEAPTGAAIEAALTKATAVLTGTPISDAVDAFESSQAIRFAKDKGRFLGSMADVNSVNASTFVFGLALLEAERGKEVDRFEADLKLQTHKDALAQYVTLYTQTLSEYIQTYIAEVVTMMQSVNTNTPAYAQVMSNVVQYYLDIYRNDLNLHTSATMQEKMRYNTGRDSFIQKGASDIINLITARVQAGLTAGHTRVEGNRIHYIMNAERKNTDIGIVDKAQRWNMDVYTFADLMLSGLSGAVPLTQPIQPTTAQSVLGGAASAAAIAALIPGVGIGVVGAAAGVGAIAGGINW